jgi:hypothetical protein
LGVAPVIPQPLRYPLAIQAGRERHNWHLIGGT